MRAVLRAHDIQTFYGKSHILHGVSVEVNEGEIVTVLGRNGAGKTTTVRSLTGLTPPRSGTIEIFGHDINENIALPAVENVEIGRQTCVADVARLNRSVDFIRRNRRRKALAGRLRPERDRGEKN